ncbi:hypothetical protein QTP86_025716 [Hemibagrus guttatus]|nr:hypothetical protein QTP86_025716 [Hemibagrus guttatus]
MDQKLENLCSLQETIQVNFRNMTPEEVALIGETFALSNQFVPLLRSATERVMQQMPSMIKTLDNIFSSLTKQLEDLVYSTTTDPYLDLNQNSCQIIPKLRLKYRQLHMIAAQLYELSETNQSLRGQPLDLSFVMTAKQNMAAWKELWELMDVSTAQIQEWRLIPFSQFVVSEAQDKVNEWLQRVNSVAKVIPTSDEVLQETLRGFEKFSQQFSLIAKLSSPTMKHKHWANIFKDVDLLADRGQNLTIGDLMSRELWEHQNKISKICSEAKAEANMEQSFQRLQQSWEGTVFRLTKFILNTCQKKHPQYGVTQQIKPSADIEPTQNDSQQNSSGRETFIIMDLETLVAQAEDSVMTLSSMLMSPHICNLKGEVDIWLQLLQELEELLDFCERYQQKWIFLSRIFNEMSRSSKNIELKRNNLLFTLLDNTLKLPSTELHARNLFVIAYIWGFGGQLHPRHWTQFDIFAREALFKCRYKIEVPVKGTVFEHFFYLSDEMLEGATCMSSFPKNRGPQHSCTSVPQATRDELLLIMETWHHVDEELKEVRPHISAVVKKSSDQWTGQVNKRSFRSKQRHIHVFLLLPLSQHFYERETEQSSVIARQITKALTLCCCVAVYHPWSTEALVEIASVHLKDSVDDNTTVASIAQAMAAIHQSATKYASIFLNTVSNQPFSPQTYIELIEYFSHLCDHFNEQVRSHANRLTTVLAHLKDMTETAQDYKQEAFRLKVKFQDAQKELSQLQMAIDTERAVCEQIHQHCLLEENCLSYLQEQLDLVEQQAQDALKEVTPLYQAALKALLSLNQSDLDEVRRYRHPPDGVVILMNAICRLFSCPCNWESGKQLLGQPNFLQVELQFFDHSKLSNELFEELGQIVQAPNFQTDLVCGVSQACESLCSWVRAVYQYACVKRCLAPQEAHKNHLNNCMAEIRARLQVARLQEEAAQDRLEAVEKQHQFVKNNLKELSAQLQKFEIQEKEAAVSIKQISDYTEKWNMAKKETEMNEHTIPGKITISPEDVRTSLFDEAQFLSTENAQFANIPVATELHRALWAHKWGLLTDTQQHKECSFTGQIEYLDKFPINAGRSEKDEEFELIVSAHDPECIHKISHGAKKGLKVLVTEIERAVPTEDFLSILDRPGGNHIFDAFHPVKALHPEFCLFLSTSLPAKVLLEEIHPLILEKVKVIDLSLSTLEVQGIILSDLIQSKCSELWLKHCQLQQDKQVLQDKLHVEEVSLVDYILQSSTPLLQDPEFLPYVKVVVVSFGSKCQRDYLLSSLNTAVQTGYWLVLNNCHLLDHWDPVVITQLRQCTGKGHWTNMEEDTGLNQIGGGAGIQVHPHFRLWLITKGSAPLSIPGVWQQVTKFCCSVYKLTSTAAFIRMCAMHLVIDSHWDLKDELCSTFRQVISTVHPAKNMVDPLLRAAVLHSVLMQRQKVKHLGHGSIYKWSYEDFLALTDAHTHLAKLCHDPVGALEYVAAYLIYGGHMSDSADLEAVEAVCRVCLQPLPSTLGSGPHILSEMISMKGHIDVDILKAVQHCIETTMNNNDTLLLGFSAEMTNEIVKIRSHTLRILLQSEDSFAAVRHYDGMFNHLPELPDYKIAKERLQNLQTHFEWTKKRGGASEGKVSLSPMHAFLQTEWENLTKTVSSLHDISASPNITSSIISELETRANLLQMYQMGECSGSPPVYCLSAFTNPRGFLAALIRETVHIKQCDISQVTLHFQVLGAAASPAFKLSNGISLSGLELHGAWWDMQLGALQDTLSPKPCPFPLLWVRAQVKNFNISYSSHSSPSNSYTMPVYNCPLYLDSQSKDGDWSLSVGNIVTYVPLMTKLDPVLCKMRRVRLVSALQGKEKLGKDYKY